IVGVEGGEAAILALHAGDPFLRTADCLAEFAAVSLRQTRCGAIHCHGDDSRIVDIGVVGIGILKGPSAGANVGSLCSPVSDQIEYLQWSEPFQAPPHAL